MCTRVCREYIKELTQIHLTENHSLLKISEDISVIYLESHQEISSFCDYFIYWNHSIEASCLPSEPVCQLFHPEDIDEDETKDETYDKHGQMKPEIVSFCSESEVMFLPIRPNQNIRRLTSINMNWILLTIENMKMTLQKRTFEVFN